MNVIRKQLIWGLSILTVATAAVGAEPASAPAPAPAAVPNASAPANPAAATTNSLGPTIKFATPVADFGRVQCGEVVKYTYVFTNTGDQLLILTNVTPGCGCTAAGEWTKTVEPGMTGSIPIQLQTINFNGPVVKFITVASNDKGQPSIMLQLKGTIWKPIEVNPPYANISISPEGQNNSMTLKITNNTAEPLFLSPPVSSNSAISAELLTNAPGKGYELLVTKLPPFTPGASQAQVTLKTSFTNPPVLTITVWANVQPPLLVIPAQLTLSQVPLPAAQTLTVTIQAFTTNTLVLTDPVVSDSRVGLQLKEVQPGRSYNALLSFPEGFEIAKDQHVEFSVKTSSATIPLVKVPVVQIGRPVPPAAPAPAAAQGAQLSPAAKHVLPPVPSSRTATQ